MITFFPSGYAHEILHLFDIENNPERHYLTKNIYTREEGLDLCCKCAEENNWKDLFVYDARSACFYRKVNK